MRYSPERLYHYSTRVFGTARVDLNRPMSFWLLFRSLHFLALVFATISLVCFGVQEKIAVPVFRGLVMPHFSVLFIIVSWLASTKGVNVCGWLLNYGRCQKPL